MKNILIIGGNGYIGSLLIKQLSKNNNYKITSIDINDKYKYDNVIYITDKYQNLNKDFYDKFNTIILLAGQSSVSSSNEIVEVIDNNIRNFSWLLELLKDNQKLIYASSSSIYGFIETEATEEFINYQPSNYYDLSKYIIDNIAKLSNKHYYGLRFGTVNGYSDNLRVDLMINSMLYNAKKNGEFIIKHKDTYRPILGINDLYNAILIILENDDKSKSGIYNLNSFNSSVIDIANKLRYITDFNYKIIEDDSKPYYNFKISSEKFISTFNFKFTETIESIINSLNGYSKTNNCKICNNKTMSILDLGKQPLANNYKININHKDDLYNLDLHLCNNCFHLQLNTIIEPRSLFENYLYISGTSRTLNDYFDYFAKKTLESYINKYNCKSIKVLEIACNDGSQLDFYKKNCDIPIITVGVDPAINIYKQFSSKKEHDIYCDYFSKDVINKLKQKYEYFDIIIAQNVVAHINYPHQFLQFAKELMTNRTDLYIQTSQKNMILENQFDTVYHEHLSFFTIKSMKLLCELNNLYLNYIDENLIHGVSYIFKINKSLEIHNNNIDLEFEKEKNNGLYDLITYKKYYNNCIAYKYKLINKLNNYKNDNYSIIAFGSTAKSMTIFNYCEINNSIIDYIIDENKLKTYLYTPLSNIQILPIDKLNDISKNTLIIITAWNFYEEVKRKIIDKIMNNNDNNNKIVLLHINTLCEEIIV